MTAQAFKLGGIDYVIVPKDEYDHLSSFAKSVEIPSFPQPNERGNLPAVEFTQVSIARDIIRDRTALGLTRDELASLAGIRVATLNRIESGKVTPSVASIDKIDLALKAAEKKKSRAQRGS